MTHPLPRISVSRLALVVAALLMGALLGAAGDDADAAGPVRFSPERPVFSSDGLALVVFPGGSFDDLEAATRAAGAAGAWVQDPKGNFQVMPVGAPAFYRQRLNELIPPDGKGGPNFRYMVSTTIVAPD